VKQRALRHIPEVLRNREFSTVLVAGLVSRLGDSLHEIALIWLVATQMEDPALVSLVVAASLVPEAVLSPFAGTYADVMNRKHIMIGANVARGVLVLLIPLSRGSGYLLPVVVGVALGTGSLNAFFSPAKSAIVPNIVGESQLDSANGLLETTNSVSRMFYAIAGLIVSVSGSFVAFYIDAATFLVSSLLLATISREAGQVGRETGQAVLDKLDISGRIEEMREGFAYVFADRRILSVIALYLLYGLTIGPFGVILPVYTEQSLQRGSDIYGFLYGSVYFGIFAGGLLLSRYGDAVVNRRGRVSIAALAVSGLPLVALGTIPRGNASSTPLAVAALVLFGLVAVGIWAPTRALIQNIVPDEKLGRVFSIVGTVSSASLPIGAAVSGPVLTVVAPTTIFVGMGATLFVAGLGLYLSPLWDVCQPTTGAAESVQ